jgi:hypothetical protein
VVLKRLGGRLQDSDIVPRAGGDVPGLQLMMSGLDVVVSKVEGQKVSLAGQGVVVWWWKLGSD